MLKNKENDLWVLGNVGWRFEQINEKIYVHKIKKE